jgi:glyoxylase-like metal-dependent hydrolase (beta-lactamase superfamily II)
MEWQLIPTGRVWVDPGGAMGLVPRPLWIDHQPVDPQQRTPMDLNSLLVRSEGKNILIDTGMGYKLDQKAQGLWGLEWPEGTLLENLARHGLAPEHIDIVIDTHLHSDHCGGNTFLEGDQVQPTFPRAEYFVQRMEFADAFHPDARTRGTYLPENFVPLWQSGQLTLLHGDTDFTPHVRTVVTRGHTRGHQSVIIQPEDGPPVFFLSDLASYALHFARTSWVTAYDVEPLETIRTKTRWQQWAYESEAVLVFQHDCYTRKGRLVKDEKGQYSVERLESGSISLLFGH